MKSEWLFCQFDVNRLCGGELVLRPFLSFNGNTPFQCAFRKHISGRSPGIVLSGMIDRPLVPRSHFHITRTSTGQDGNIRFSQFKVNSKDRNVGLKISKISALHRRTIFQSKSLRDRGYSRRSLKIMLFLQTGTDEKIWRNCFRRWRG